MLQLFWNNKKASFHACSVFSTLFDNFRCAKIHLWANFTKVKDAKPRAFNNYYCHGSRVAHYYLKQLQSLSYLPKSRREGISVMKKILIADDSRFMRHWLKRILSENNKNFTFFEAENGYQAIDLYKQNSPNIVLMDITMPKLNGIEALKEIIKLDSAANVIMCSSLGQQPLIVFTIKIGAKDFVVKPYFNNLTSIANKYL